MDTKSILVAGAGRSSANLIQYLSGICQEKNWRLIVGDISLEAAQQRCQNHPLAKAIHFDIALSDDAEKWIKQSDLVISLLPAHLHPEIAAICIRNNTHLITASYLSAAMQAMHEEAQQKGLLFLNECGFDPGIDHMSAMEVIDGIKAKEGKLISFESFAGGLISPESEKDNPWKYKFTWNPRNIVMAGQGTARYIHGGKVKFIAYPQLFKRITTVHVDGYGDFEGYANRDSTVYKALYGLDDIQTLLRGTLRKAGFCSAWNVFVQLGMTDDTWKLIGLDKMTHADFTASFLAFDESKSLEEKLADAVMINTKGEEMLRLRWSGLLDETPIGIGSGSPAEILQHILNKRWALQAGDKDMIVLWHRFVYQNKIGETKIIISSLVDEGIDEVFTAMAKTVGLPMGIAAKLLLENKIQARGVQIPVSKEFYEPILAELKNQGLKFVEKELTG